MTYQLAYTNSNRVGKTLLPLIAESSGTEMIVIGGSQTFRRTETSFDDNTSKIIIIKYDKATATIVR